MVYRNLEHLMRGPFSPEAEAYVIAHVLYSTIFPPPVYTLS